jgi:hypothetical protein
VPIAWSLPYAAAAAAVGVAFLGLAKGIHKAGEDYEDIQWDPVWVGGAEPWVIKVYRNPEHVIPAERGWAVDILLYGEHKYNKEWRGMRAKYVSLPYVRAYANRWIRNYKAAAEGEQG